MPRQGLIKVHSLYLLTIAQEKEMPKLGMFNICISNMSAHLCCLAVTGFWASLGVSGCHKRGPVKTLETKDVIICSLLFLYVFIVCLTYPHKFSS